MRTVMALALGAAVMTGCTSPDTPTVEQAWVRLGAVPSRPSALYFTLHGGPLPVTLIGVTTDVTVSSEMHESMAKGGMTTMAPLARLAVPARADIVFAPGGRHVMLFDVNPGIKPGGRRPVVTLSFADGQRLVTTAIVVGPGQPMPDA